MNKTICIICQNKLNFYVKGKDYLYQTNKKEYAIFVCSGCHVEQIVPLPTPKEIKEFYPKNYYSYHKSKKNIFLSLREKVIEIAYTKEYKKDMLYYLTFLCRKFLYGVPLQHFGKRKFLDVGCGNEYNMKLLEKYGWESYGFEMGEKAKKGNIYYDDNLTKVSFDHEEFDYIRIWHVLEHVTEPHDFLKKIHALLSKDGRVVIGLPNAQSLYAKLFRSYWYGRDIPRHVFSYNPSNLRLLLEKNKLQIVTVNYLSVGGLLGSLQHLINDRYDTRINLINNKLLVLLFLPLDIILNTLKYGDSIAIEVKRA